ncbi:MAG: hypothetical protein AB7D36_09080 [Oscillospiraceae bacterium]
MRPYKAAEELNQFIGRKFETTDSELEKFNGFTAKSVKELTEKEYDRDLVNVDANGNEYYEINTMYSAILTNGLLVIAADVFEDELAETTA